MYEIYRLDYVDGDWVETFVRGCEKESSAKLIKEVYTAKEGDENTVFYITEG